MVTVTYFLKITSCIFHEQKHVMAQVKLTGVYRSAVSALQLLGTSHSVYNKCRNPNNFSNKKNNRLCM